MGNARNIDIKGHSRLPAYRIVSPIVHNDMLEIAGFESASDSKSPHVHEQSAISIKTIDGTSRFLERNSQGNLGSVPHPSHG